MAKYMILYNAAENAQETMASASPEEMKASMDEWIAWKDGLSSELKFDFGMPMQAVSHLTADGTGKSDSQASGYSFIEGDSKEAIAEVVKSHPHLKRPGASIDILEILAMPGINPN